MTPAPTQLQPPRSVLGRVSAAFDSAGKIATGVASFGVFVFLIGGAVLGRRVEGVSVPSEEVLSQFPQQRLLAVGLVELLWTVLAAALTGAVLFAGFRRGRLLPRGRENSAGSGSRFLNRLIGFVVFSVVAVGLWVTPISWAGAVWGVALIALLLYSGWLEHRDPHVWEILLVAFALAAVLTIARQAEFPAQLPDATVTFKADAESAPSEPLGSVNGRLVNETDSEVWLAITDPDDLDAVGFEDPQLLLISRDQVARIALSRPGNPPSPAESPAQRLLGLDAVCLPPTCRVGNEPIEPPSP